MANRWKLNEVREVIGLDVRSLGLFRVGLALVLLIDLLIRFGDLSPHYTDAGVLPTATVQPLLRPLYWSVFLLSGNPVVQSLVFCLAIFLALGLLVGYRTRLVTIACWIMIISLHNRNPYILFAADDVMRALLFWSMFLPLGAAYSIDSALNTNPEPLPKRIASAATIAFMLQVCYFYTWSALFKSQNEPWINGDAVYYSLAFDQYGAVVGQWLLNFPYLLKPMTHGALLFEWVGALVIFIPIYNSLWRIVGVISFTLLHISFGLCFEIGLFPYIGVAIWMAFIPSQSWDWMYHKLSNPQRKGLKINYDADCGFCKKMVYLLRTFLILPGTPILEAQANASIYEDMKKYNSWVVVDWQEERHYKWEAITYICSLSPIFFFLVPILRWAPLMLLGNKLYEFIASNRRLAGNFTKPFKWRSLTVDTPIYLNIILAILIVLTFLWNLKSFTTLVVNKREVKQQDWINTSYSLVNRRTFQTINLLGNITRLDQSWNIFGGPPRDDGWHVLVGKLKNGQTVDLLSGETTVSWEKPTIAQRNKIYGNMQWRTYFINLNRSIGTKLYPPYGNYLCAKWNATHSEPEQLDSIEIYFIDERTAPPGEKQIVTKKKPWQQSCDVK